MLASVLLDACMKAGISFFAGVPDSYLKGLCDELFARYGTDGFHHIVAHNEGGAIALCAGHALATGRPALCYMQNSGLGNAVNPLASLTDEKVYAIPCLLVIAISLRVFLVYLLGGHSFYPFFRFKMIRYEMLFQEFLIPVI